MRKFLTGLTAAVILLACPMAAQAEAGLSCFRDLGEQVLGIWITEVPASGSLRLGSRRICRGDVLTADQARNLTWIPGADGALSCLTVETGGLGEPRTLVLGSRNRPPIAEDSAMETYRDLPNQGKLKVREPEGEAMTFILVRPPRRGSVELRSDGSFLYTPDKRKAGMDFFTYTARDPQGQLSREARVTVEILKPTEVPQYVDTLGRSCRFAAEWMKHTGLFAGESIGGSLCFRPDQPVTRGEFLAALVKAMDLPLQQEVTLPEQLAQVPRWFRPYAWAALRSGLFAPLSGPDTFDPEIPITGHQARALINEALDQPFFAAGGGAVLTRAQGAELLRQAFSPQ